MGRKPLDGGRANLTLAIPRPLREWIDEQAAREKTTPSGLARRVLTEYRELLERGCVCQDEPHPPPSRTGRPAAR